MSKKYWDVIGMMSGTSLDGVDIIYTRISKNIEKYNFKILHAVTIPYPKEWEQKLIRAFTSSTKDIAELNVNYAIYLSGLINEFIRKNKITKIDFIASHGHTIFHKPNEGYTLQIGDGQTISNITGLKVICDFRTEDVALGGQGAPLVPIGDRLLFSEYDYCLNLGGFANISSECKNERIAYDICPVNIVLNHYAKKLGFSYDESGCIAKKGKIDKKLLKKLNDIPFYKASIPKSLGFEFVEDVVFPLIEAFHLNIEDILRTFVAHIVTQIHDALDNSKNSKLLVTGGGTFNVFLINELKSITENEIVIPASKIINYKEALIFALLGILRSQNQVNCLRSVTGAMKDHSSGKIFLKTD
jgi:anhydro-N-acetylmuramic acid kinase